MLSTGTTTPVTCSDEAYLWWRDAEGMPNGGLRPLAHVYRFTSREADFDWTLNRTCIHLQRTDVHGVVRVQLESSMPALCAHRRLTQSEQAVDMAVGTLACGEARASRLQVRLDEGAWRDSVAEFTWTLLRGGNHLAARSVSAAPRWGGGAALQCDRGGFLANGKGHHGGPGRGNPSAAAPARRLRMGASTGRAPSAESVRTGGACRLSRARLPFDRVIV